MTYADSTTTEITYDGMDRWVKIVEKNAGGTVTSTRNLVWDGMGLLEERNGAVVRGYYAEGFLEGSAKYYYTRDHLGSIREVFDETGADRAAYDYSPWGERGHATYNPPPVSGSRTHRSEVVAGIHQHYFYGATTPVALGAGDKLVCWVYLDPKNPPREIMLQFETAAAGWDWEHRAYWGENVIPWGADGTAARKYMGALPATGGWTRLEIPASAVGLEANTISGMAFTMYDGRAWWDSAGKRANGAGSDTTWFDDALPAGAVPVADSDSWTFTKVSVNASFAFTGHYFDVKSALHVAPSRFYDAKLGRWLSRDPFGSVTSQMNAVMFGTASVDYYLMGISQPETLPFGSNLYAYVGGNQVNYVDPEGEIAPWVAAALVGAVVGGGLDLAEQLLSNGGNFECVDWGDVGTSALAGAATSFLGPTGGLLGRGGAKAVGHGYSKSAGLLNHGNTRFGWGYNQKSGRDVLRGVSGRNKTDILGSGVKSGANPGRDGAVSGAIGGGAEAIRNGTGGGCP
jgi:RHS repeat-associated protein